MAQDDLDRNQDEKVANALLDATLRMANGSHDLNAIGAILQAHWLRRIAVELSSVSVRLDSIRKLQ